MLKVMQENQHRVNKKESIIPPDLRLIPLGLSSMSNKHGVRLNFEADFAVRV